MWKTTNYKGEQVWYSEEEYEELKKIIAELEILFKDMQNERENDTVKQA
jgi:hypothetical protein